MKFVSKSKIRKKVSQVIAATRHLGSSSGSSLLRPEGIFISLCKEKGKKYDQKYLEHNSDVVCVNRDGEVVVQGL